MKAHRSSRERINAAALVLGCAVILSCLVVSVVMLVHETRSVRRAIGPERESEWRSP